MLKFIQKKLPLFFIIAVLIISILPMTVSAKPQTITSCVDMLNVDKNQSGEGYYWANRTDVLTLTNLTIDTSDKFGLYLPAGATVVLVGDNYIKASYAALVCAGNTQIKGDGTLTLVSDNYGIYMNASNFRTTVTLVEGTYNITAKNVGIYSPSNEFLISGGTANINVTDPSGMAADCHSLKLNTATLKANAPLHAKHDLHITATNLELSAASPVLVSDNEKISFGQMDISEYNGENSITSVSTLKRFTKSILFGGNIPIYVDYILVAALIVIAGGVIFLKVYRQKRRDAIRRAEVERIKSEQKKLKANK